jgi:hypothetical protein
VAFQNGDDSRNSWLDDLGQGGGRDKKIWRLSTENIWYLTADSAPCIFYFKRAQYI